MNDNASIPLVVDLDGTLVRSDLLVEAFVILIRKNPLAFFSCILWFLRGGKYLLKFEISKKVDLRVDLLPYNEKIIENINSAKSHGRSVWLATASHVSYADKVAAHLNVFDGVFATDKNINLSSLNKANCLVNKFGLYGFDYIGNSMHDLSVWRCSRTVISVNPSRAMVRKIKEISSEKKVILNNDNIFLLVIRAIRAHQWVKNTLIFVPVIAAHAIDASIAVSSLYAFIAFSFCASAIYIVNDIFDLEVDRLHPRKRYRPFASGQLSLLTGGIIFFCLAFLALAFSLMVSVELLLVLIAYFLMTTLYSLKIKSIPMADVIVLALLYSIRLVAGSVATGIALSFWLLVFSMFIFLSLAMIKRYAEIVDMQKEGEEKSLRGRGYLVSDLALLSSLGGASGYMSVLVLAFYINSVDVSKIYMYPQLIWLMCPIFLYWISRMWLIAHRGLMHDDPIVFALKDRASIAAAVLLFVIMLIAHGSVLG
jgi:4-hydroxybenzoate polyprenyltransferase